MNKSPDCKDRKCKDGIVEEQETPSGGKFNIFCPICFWDIFTTPKEPALPKSKPEKSE